MLFFMVDNSMLFAGFVFVLWLIWGGVASFFVLLPIGVSHWWWWLRMTMGRGGAGLKDGVFAPAPAPHDKENFSTPSPPLGAPQILAPPCKTLLFVNLPSTITIFFNKT